MHYLPLVALIIMLAVVACMVEGKSGLSVRSPDGKVMLEFRLIQGVPYYSIHYDDIEIIRPSSMGFSFRRMAPMRGDFEIAKTISRSFAETWRPVWGEKKEIENRYNELTVEIREKLQSGRIMRIVFRVFDDGVGFRYELPEQENLRSFEIIAEETRFSFSGNHTTWWIPADFDSYEHLYSESPLSEVRAVNTPVTMETEDGLFIAIHEANLTDYAGMTLSADQGKALILRSSLVPWPDGTKVKGSTPLKTPWRTIQIASRAGSLIESDLILNLNEPALIEDTSWIKPMKYIGIWWAMHIGKYTWHIGPDHGATTENARRYIDFASEHGIQGVLIEGWNTGWDKWGQKDAYDYKTPYPDFDLEEVIGYARNKGVYIVGHHETGGDAEGYEKHIDSAFAMYERLGVPAVKTGYAGRIHPRGQHHHGQWMVNHYRLVLGKAADHRLVLDVHEPIKPTGLRRTYPNMMTAEGARGTEFSAWSEGNPPEHTTILPFTRMLAGPLDYTPGIFDLRFDKYKEDNRVRTTLANQLALYVVLYSPFQMAADLPEAYQGHPAFGFIEDVAVDWDETKVLAAKIGDYVTIARRSGEDWFIGSITDENARELIIDLSFLDLRREYHARIYADAPGADWDSNPTAIEIRDRTVESGSKLRLGLAPGGGQAIRLTPVGAE